MAAIIGHHFALAGDAHRAVHHLEVAGKYAAARFAIDEAVSSFRKAIAIADADGASPAASQSVVDLRYQLAEVLWRNSRLDEARQVLREALDLVDPGRWLQAARLQARLGRVEVEDLRTTLPSPLSRPPTSSWAITPMTATRNGSTSGSRSRWTGAPICTPGATNWMRRR